MQNSIIAIIIGILTTFSLIFLTLLAYVVIIQWKMFKKAGKPGWASIIPVYNIIVLLDIIGYKWYYVFLFFAGIVPIIGGMVAILFGLISSIKLAKSFGQEIEFGIGLWLLSPIFIGIISFKKDINYIGPVVKGDIDFNDLF